MLECIQPCCVCRFQVKDQNNSAYALRQIYQKLLQPYEQYCAEQEAADAEQESQSALMQPSSSLRKGELGENMAAQVLGAMLAASAADVKGPGAGAGAQAEQHRKKRRRTEQVCERSAIGVKAHEPPPLHILLQLPSAGPPHRGHTPRYY